MGLPHQVTGNVERIRLIVLGVDGVLTDGRVGILPDGTEVKYYSIYDGLAIRLAKMAGFEVVFISGRTSKEVNIRARELGVETVIQGSRDKKADLEKLVEDRGLELDEVAFVGDDLPDIPLLQSVGLSAAPENAAEPVLKTSGKWDEIIGCIGTPDAPAAG